MKTYLHLENGLKFEGNSFGYHGESPGEIVFTTGMTGYVESLTDPSFAGQIIVFTYPLIGNYGVPKLEFLTSNIAKNYESEKIWAKGVVVGEFSIFPSHYQSQQSLSEFLTNFKVPGISGIDTRYLTHIIREVGCMKAAITPDSKFTFTNNSNNQINYVKNASVSENIIYNDTKKSLKHIALIDCGVKHGILRKLLKTNCKITQIPFDQNPLNLHNIDGVICSNGPGDPKVNLQTIKNITKLVENKLPFLGICLGHQLLSLAIGANTYKLRYGHRGINQPVQDVITNKAYITSQNHGYAVDRNTIPKDYLEWFINLNDNTSEGIRSKNQNILSVQFHPEGYPGPNDTEFIFDEFITNL